MPRRRRRRLSPLFLSPPPLSPVKCFDSRCFHQGGDLGGGGDIEDLLGHCVIRCPVHGRRIDLADGRCVDTDLAGDFCVVSSQGDAALSSQGDTAAAAALPPHRVHPVFVDSDGTLRVLIQASGPPRASDRYNVTDGGGGPGTAVRPPGVAGVGLGGFPVSPRRAAGLASGVARGAPRPMAYDDDVASGRGGPSPSSSSGGGDGPGGGGRSSSTSGEGGRRPGGGAAFGLGSQGPLTPFAGPQADKWAATATAPGGAGLLPAHFRGRKRGSEAAAAAVPVAKAPPPPPPAPHNPTSPAGTSAAFAARGAAARRAVLERSLGGGGGWGVGGGATSGPTQRTLHAFFSGAAGGRQASGGEVGGGAVAMDE